MAAHPRTGTVLYYPHFVMEASWLKRALLYWDRVDRIVPDRAGVADTYAVTEAKDAGLVVRVSPEPYLIQAATRFAQKLPDVLHASMKDRVYSEKDVSIGVAQSFSLIHEDKLNYFLRDLMERNGLATTNTVPFPNWRYHGGSAGPRDQYLVLPTDLARAYMMILAGEMADGLKVPLATDDRHDELGRRMTYGEPPDRMSDHMSLLFTLGFPFPSHEQMADVPMQKVIEFDKKYHDEKVRFRSAVEGFAEEVRGAESPAVLEDIYSQQRREIEDAMKNHAKALEAVNIKTFGSSVALSVPGLAVSASAMLNGVHPIFGYAASAVGIAVSAVVWGKEHAEARRRAIQECPWHYMLRVNRAMGQGTRDPGDRVDWRGWP